MPCHAILGGVVALPASKYRPWAARRPLPPQLFRIIIFVSQRYPRDLKLKLSLRRLPSRLFFPQPLPSRVFLGLCEYYYSSLPASLRGWWIHWSNRGKGVPRNWRVLIFPGIPRETSSMCFRVPRIWRDRFRAEGPGNGRLSRARTKLWGTPRSDMKRYLILKFGILNCTRPPRERRSSENSCPIASSLSIIPRATPPAVSPKSLIPLSRILAIRDPRDCCNLNDSF